MKVSLEDIIKGEIETYQITHNTLKGCHENVPNAINLLLQLMYFTGPRKDVNTPEGEFHSYAWHKYMEAPYSFRACYILYERAYYLNATFIIRYLLEALVQCKYAFNHKERTGAIWTGKHIEINGKKRHIKFKEMFDENTPGYYKKYYGNQLASFAHGKIGADNFRVNRKTPTNGEVIMIPRFDEMFASYVINQTQVFLLGYLNLFPKFFPEGFMTLTEDLSEEYKKSKQWLNSCIDGHKKVNPSSLKWYEHIEKIIKP